jgi:putative acetyltransferase
MYKFLKTDSANPHFVRLVELLDIELAERDGHEYAFYQQFNSLAEIKHVVICYVDETPVACGSIKPFDERSMEVKRMFTLPAYRGKGIAALLLAELEYWAKELGYEKCVLETGTRQPEAIALYKKCSYQIIPNYGQYAGVNNSICFEKVL